MDVKKGIKRTLLTSIGFAAVYLGIDFFSESTFFPYDKYRWRSHYVEIFTNPEMSQHPFVQELLGGKFKTLTYKFSHLSSDTFLLFYNIQKTDDDGKIKNYQLVIPRPVGHFESLTYLLDSELLVKSSPMKVIKAREEFEGLERHIISLLNNSHSEVRTK